MFIFFILFLAQCVIAIIVIFVLKKLLDKELMRAALEKFASCPSSADIKEITVFSASKLNSEFQYQFESIRKRKFVHTTLNFRTNADLKGGVVITIGDLLLDFSVSSRLQHFWS